MLEITIEKLFGVFDYHLSFERNKISIITGPNGFGKSTVLRMLNSLCNNDFAGLMKVQFHAFSLTNEDSSLRIGKSDSSFSVDDIVIPFPNQNVRPLWRAIIPSYLHRMDESHYLNIRTNEIVYVESYDQLEKDRYGFISRDRFFYDIIDTSYPAHHKDLDKITSNVSRAINKIEAFKKNIGKVDFIREQRLLEKKVARDKFDDETIYVNVIEECSESIKKLLLEALKQHSLISNNLDGTYLHRLIKEKNKLSIDKYRENYERIKKTQGQLQRYGLAEREVSFLEELDREKVDQFGIELSIYFNDYFQKYDVFDPLIQKITLFEELIHEKLFKKTLKIHKDEGITVWSEDGRTIGLSSLSSGEQEIIVLFFKLIFESDANYLLIDEPEISLHISWQRELMENIKRIQQCKNDLTIILATHSPHIIANNWSLQTDLAEQVDD